MTRHRTCRNKHDSPLQRMHFMLSFQKSNILSSLWFPMYQNLVPIKGVYLVSHYIGYSDHSAIVNTWTSNGHVVIRSTLDVHHLPHTNTFPWEKWFASSSEKLINLCYKKWNMSILVDHFHRISKGLPWSELVLYHLHAELVCGNINTYLHFPSFINIALVIEIFSCGRRWPVYPIQCKPWLLMSSAAGYWPGDIRIFQFQQQNS